MMKDIPLGKHTDYVSQYDASLLFPIAREGNRERLALKGSIPFVGQDIWTGYELSWLDGKGKPKVAIVEFTIPADSKNIIESKSFKLYLNSFNQTKFGSEGAVRETLIRDLSAGFDADVVVKIFPVNDFPLSTQTLGELIDDLDVDHLEYQPNAELLVCGEGRVEESLCSHLLKSNCPVTGQPDWATLTVRYAGTPIDHQSLLKYVISYRDHSDFHEHCVESIFCDLLNAGSFDELVVMARYTRRGGLDINPVRSLKSLKDSDVLGRLARQ